MEPESAAFQQAEKLRNEYCVRIHGEVRMRPESQWNEAMATGKVEVVGEEAEIEGLVELLRPFGIVEMVRAGVVAMGRAEHVLDTVKERSSWAERRFPVAKAS